MRLFLLYWWTAVNYSSILRVRTYGTVPEFIVIWSYRNCSNMLRGFDFQFWNAGCFGLLRMSSWTKSCRNLFLHRRGLTGPSAVLWMFWPRYVPHLLLWIAVCELYKFWPLKSLHFWCVHISVAIRDGKTCGSPLSKKTCPKSDSSTTHPFPAWIETSSCAESVWNFSCMSGIHDQQMVSARKTVLLCRRRIELMV